MKSLSVLNTHPISRCPGHIAKNSIKLLAFFISGLKRHSASQWQLQVTIILLSNSNSSFHSRHGCFGLHTIPAIAIEMCYVYFLFDCFRESKVYSTTGESTKSSSFYNPKLSVTKHVQICRFSLSAAADPADGLRERRTSTFNGD